MSPFITYTLLVFMAAHGVVLLVELVRMRRLLRFAVQVALLGLVFVLLRATVNFPTPRQAFGGASLLATVVLMLVCTILGMTAQSIFSAGESQWSWGRFVRPIRDLANRLFAIAGLHPRIEAAQRYPANQLRLSGISKRLLLESGAGTCGSEDLASGFVCLPSSGCWAV